MINKVFWGGDTVFRIEKAIRLSNCKFSYTSLSFNRLKKVGIGPIASRGPHIFANRSDTTGIPELRSKASPAVLEIP